MAYRKILVTLDGSKIAEKALDHLLEIAPRGAAITLLSVMAEDRPSEVAALSSVVSQNSKQPDTTNWPPVQQIADPHQSDAREAYLKRVTDWLAAAGYDVDTQILEGNPIEQIVDIAKRGYDIIIMVTHRRTGLSKVAIGSVTDGVLQKAPCPVVVIPARAD
jgi:nucleotide-binding universal stress UspA family protein